VLRSSYLRQISNPAGISTFFDIPTQHRKSVRYWLLIHESVDPRVAIAVGRKAGCLSIEKRRGC
jgi:hypothetical protein